jgi:hypothetical protein
MLSRSFDVLAGQRAGAALRKTRQRISEERMVHGPGRRPPCPQAQFHFDVFDIASNREIDNLFVEGVTNDVQCPDRLEIDQRRNQEAVDRGFGA